MMRLVSRINPNRSIPRRSIGRLTIADNLFEIRGKVRVYYRYVTQLFGVDFIQRNGFRGAAPRQFWRFDHGYSAMIALDNDFSAIADARKHAGEIPRCFRFRNVNDRHSLYYPDFLLGSAIRRTRTRTRSWCRCNSWRAYRP